MKETGGRCGAALQAHNHKSGETYIWDSCTEDPGHPGHHSVWSERDSDTWAEWNDDGSVPPHSAYAHIEDMAPIPSPWTADELAAYEEVDL
jgi:hypothetical protein